MVCNLEDQPVVTVKSQIMMALSPGSSVSLTNHNMLARILMAKNANKLEGVNQQTFLR